MPKSGLTTTQEGYGWTHQRARARLAALLRDGDPCRRCARPMFRWQLAVGPHDRRGLDAGHSDGAKAQGLPPDQLEHRPCNRRAGARVGNARHRGGARPRVRVHARPRGVPLPQW